MKTVASNRFGTRFLLIVLIVYAPGLTVIHAATSPLDSTDFARGFDISEALVALVSFATTPGIQNANSTVEVPDDQPNIELNRTSFEIGRSFGLRSRWLKLFGGFGLSHIYLNDPVKVQNTDGDTIIGNPERDLYAVRLSGGLAFQLTPHIKATPYMSFIISELDSKLTVSGNADLSAIPPELKPFFEDFSTKATTIAGTLELNYDRWFDRRRIELFGRYTLGYTNTFDESKDFIKSSGDVEILDLEGRWTAPTGIRAFEIPLRWKLIGGYTRLYDIAKSSLGFEYFFKYGAGLDLEVDVKLFDFFNLRNIGVNLVGIAGDDITGWSIGISFTN